MDVNSSIDVCALNADACGTGNTYPVTVRPTIGGGGGGGDTGGGGTGGGGTGGGGTGGTGLDDVVTAVIDRLANVIEFSHLAQSLRTRIDIINTLEKGLNDFSTKVATDNSVMAQQLLGLRGDLTNAVAYINSKITIELDDRHALVNSINQIVASLGDGLSAAIQEESTVRAEQTGALFAEKVIKTDLAGHVSGYGLSAYADKTGAVSEFRIAADRFSIAPPAYVSPAPPSYYQLHNGKVWVDTSAGVDKAVTKWWDAPSNAWSLTPVKVAQPFMYLTSPMTMEDGTVVQPGMYVNNATIANATITSAKIGSLQVGTDKISNNAVTDVYAAGGGKSVTVTVVMDTFAPVVEIVILNGISSTFFADNEYTSGPILTINGVVGQLRESVYTILNVPPGTYEISAAVAYPYSYTGWYAHSGNIEIAIKVFKK